MAKEISFIPRSLDLKKIIDHKSCFLLGPRGVGKTFWIKQSYPNAAYINLLKSRERKRYLEDPSLLQEFAKIHSGIIIIDEIQKIPALLDEVHDLIESEGRVFLLTGSSARKIKKERGNLLAGRASKKYLFPLSWYELQENKMFDFEKYLLQGGLPLSYLSDDYVESLSDYVDLYLTEEIKAEALVRNIGGFERFLYHVGLRSGDVINYDKFANDIQISSKTIKEYLFILEDTLIGFFLNPFNGPKKKSITNPKFYLFDLGVKWFLCDVNSLPRISDLFGVAFEHFIILECRTYFSQNQKKKPLFYYWRTHDQDEIDLIVEGHFALEIKSSTKITSKHLKSMKNFALEAPDLRRIIVSFDSIKRKIDDIELWPWEDFFKELWSGKLLSR